MKRLSLLINDVYNKYLPLSEKQHVSLDLNITDFDDEVDDVEEIQAHLDDQLQNLLKKPRKNGAISLGIQHGYIVIRDSETALSPLVCAALSHGRVEIKSRVGFGTTVYISVKSKTPDEQKQLKESSKQK